MIHAHSRTVECDRLIHSRERNWILCSRWLRQNRGKSVRVRYTFWTSFLHASTKQLLQQRMTIAKATFSRLQAIAHAITVLRPSTSETTPTPNLRREGIENFPRQQRNLSKRPRLGQTKYLQTVPAVAVINWSIGLHSQSFVPSHYPTKNEFWKCTLSNWL